LRGFRGFEEGEKDTVPAPVPPAQPSAGCRLILVTGLPGAGKTTLARLLARRQRLPLLAKDTIKEPLLSVLGAQDSGPSRSLSDASFAVLFALARDLLGLGSSLILEGNFRAGEHEAQLAPSGLPGTPSIAQVLCQVPEDLRRQRLLARRHDPSRHPGHRDADLLPTTGGAAHLDLPGARFTLATHAGEPPAAWLASLDRWLAT
jgi:predicted kinase